MWDLESPHGETEAGGRFWLDIRTHFFAERMVRPWQRLPRAVGECPSLEGLNRHVDGALG